MADPTEVITPDPIVETPAPVETHVEAPEYSAEEQQALDGGWVPKDQWKGDPNSWRPARDFNDRGEFFKRIDRLEHKNKELNQALTFLTEQHKRTYLNGFNNAIAQLRSQRDKALEEGDNLSAQRINDKIEDVKDRAKVAQATVVTPSTTPEPTATYTSWASKNTWYTQDKVLTKYAEAVGATFKEENPSSSEAEMLRAVETEVKREFPHKFVPKGAPSPEGTGRGTGPRSGNNTGKYASIEANLSSEERSIMNTMMKSAGMTKEEYFKMYSGQ